MLAHDVAGRGPVVVLLPGTRPVELPWARHLPTLERPRELTGLLTAFLREAVAAG